MEILGLSDARPWQESKVRTYAVKRLFNLPDTQDETKKGYLSKIK